MAYPYYNAFRGATAWEGYIGPLWYRLNYPRFWRVAVLRVGFDKEWFR